VGCGRRIVVWGSEQEDTLSGWSQYTWEELRSIDRRSWRALGWTHLSWDYGLEGAVSEDEEDEGEDVEDVEPTAAGDPSEGEEQERGGGGRAKRRYAHAQVLALAEESRRAALGQQRRAQDADFFCPHAGRVRWENLSGRARDAAHALKVTPSQAPKMWKACDAPVAGGWWQQVRGEGVGVRGLGYRLLAAGSSRCEVTQQVSPVRRRIRWWRRQVSVAASAITSVRR